MEAYCPDNLRLDKAPTTASRYKSTKQQVDTTTATRDRVLLYVHEWDVLASFETNT